MAIKAFVFDCGGVLLRDGDLSAYDLWENRLGLGSGELASRLWQGETWARAARGELTERQFWMQAGQELGLGNDDLVDALREDLWGTWVVDEKVLAIIDVLRERYRVAMLSNATDALEELLEKRYQIADRFETVVNSSRVGVAKPDARIYQTMLQALDVEAKEVIFVDDRAENVAAAAGVGMHIIWYVHAAELERQLSAYLSNGDGHDLEMPPTVDDSEGLTDADRS